VWNELPLFIVNGAICQQQSHLPFFAWWTVALLLLY